MNRNKKASKDDRHTASFQLENTADFDELTGLAALIYRSARTTSRRHTSYQRPDLVRLLLALIDLQGEGEEVGVVVVTVM